MSLLSYWPTQEEVDRCVKSEAESASDEVLLSVHQQFPLVYMKVGADGRVMTDSRTLATEDDLLQHLLGRAPEGSLVVPITGASGIGKSHLIRILDARLRKLPDANRYLVIRIPKSASLRRVVELILEAEPLKGPSYERIRAEFNKALSDVPLAQAVILFQAQLKIALNDYATELLQRLRQEPTNGLLKSHLHIARGLPQFLGDAITENYFYGSVLPRVIHRSVEGVKDQNTDVDPTNSQFKSSDFDLPDSVDMDKASLPVRNFYHATLCTMGGQGKTLAAEVLNSVVDKATRQLYKLHESLGGKTLGEVIGDIRHLLLEEDSNKELIFLVEDFAALVGIQDTLAKIFIQHGEADGKRTHATIRSVIAVTDGYLAGRDTLATRAGREWVVESRLESEAEALRRTGLLVASYLNAARHGESFLKEYFRKTNLGGDQDNKEIKMPIYEDGTGECEDILNGFGKISGIPLFPFTETAIECLVRSSLTSANELVFNPRFIIKNVIREVLLTGREAFTQDHFPPPGINGKPLSGEVAQWLASQPISIDQKKRYERLISVWGNNPKSLRDVSQISPQVFDTFRLPRLILETERPPPTKPTPEPGDTKGVSAPPSSPPDEEIGKVNEYREELERWVQEGTRLPQAIANKIRQSIAALVNQRIDWNSERCLKREFRADKFSIPNAGGEAGLATEVINVADSTEDPEGRLRGELLALLRLTDIHNGNPDYVEADEDLARVSNLIDRLLPDALALLRISIGKQTRSVITLLAANSRLLGLAEKGRTPGTISSFLFGEVSLVNELPDTAPGPFKEWRSLQREAFQIRDQLKQMLLETCGCFQGTGKSAYGVDTLHLIEHYPDENSTAEFADIPNMSPELRSLLNKLRPPVVGTRFSQLLGEANKIQARIVKELGNDFDKQEVLNAISEIASSLKATGAWRSDIVEKTPIEFTRLCEAFRTSAVKEALSVLQGPLLESLATNSVTNISKAAQLPLEPLLVTDQFLTYAEKVVRVAATHAKTLEIQHGGVTPDEKAKELVSVFDRLVADLAALE